MNDRFSHLLKDCATGQDVSELLRRAREKIVLSGNQSSPLLLELNRRAEMTLSSWFGLGLPAGFWADNDRLYAQDLTFMLGDDVMPRCRDYWQLRGCVHAYQCKHGISGLVPRTITIRGSEFSYLDWDRQLVLLPPDLATLRLEAQRIVSQFFVWASGYSLFSGSSWDDEGPTPCEAHQIDAAAKAVSYAQITLQSWQGEVEVEKPEPDEIELSLRQRAAEDCRGDLYFTAYSPNAEWKP